MSANVYDSYWLSDQFVKLIKKKQLLSLYLSQICVKLSILRLGSLLWVTLVLICRRYQLHGCLLLLFSRFLSTANSDLEGNCIETTTTTTTTTKKKGSSSCDLSVVFENENVGLFLHVLATRERGSISHST